MSNFNDQDSIDIKQNLKNIKNKILVMSGKGGVGKSTIASNLASYLASNSKTTGLLDIDIHGPSIPKLLGLVNIEINIENDRIIPIEYNDFLKVMSIGFFLKLDSDAVIWRGPKKYSLIKQFLKDVEWNDLDNLIVDCPPGTGDELLAIVQLMENMKGAIIVTTPQDLSLIDVKKSISFCRELNVPILGIIENMSGFICPECKTKIDIFKSGGGENLAKEMDVPYLGSIPIFPQIVKNSDEGTLIFNSTDESSFILKNSFQKCFKFLL